MMSNVFLIPMAILSFLSLFIINSQALETTQTNGLPDLTSNRNFQSIEIKSLINLDSFEGSIQGYELTCEQGVNGKIGFCSGECDEEVGHENGARVSAKCAESLDAFLPKCLEAIGCTDSAAFCGVGGYAKRTINTPGGESDTPSRHSTGDALDLFGLRCKGPNGENRNIDFSKEARERNMRSRSADATDNVNRYDVFVKCWREQVDRYKAQNNINCGGALSCQGSEPPNNELHNDHVHLSCPVPRSNVANI